MAASASREPWPVHERRAVVAAALALAGGILALVDWCQLVVPIQQSFTAGGDAELLLRQVPDMAGLLALPMIGVIGARIPARRMLLGAGALMFAGALAMTTAPTIVVFVPGLALLSAGRVLTFTVAVATVAEMVRDDRRRASAFATLGMMAPALELLAPPLAAWLLGHIGWRAVGGIWIGAGVIVLVASRLAVETPSRPPQAPRKPWAPLMMGIALVGFVQWLSATARHGLVSAPSLAWLATAVAGGVLWRTLLERPEAPASLRRLLRAPGLVPMLVVQVLGQCTNLWFFVFVIDRYVHVETPLHSALIAVPAQVAGLIGARVVGWLSPRIGLRRTGTIFLGMQAVSFFVACVQTVDLPIAVTAGILCVYGFFCTGSFVCLSRGVMDTAPAGDEQSVSSYRTMAAGIGSAIGTLVINIALVGAMSRSMRVEAQQRGLTAETTQALVDAVRRNTPNLRIMEDLEFDDRQLAELRAMRKEVIVDGFRAQALVCGMVIGLSAAGFWLARRDPPRTHPAMEPAR
jgi:predicted MFS family arabinose efflux permease